MVQLAVAMAIVLASWAALGLMLVGLGLLVPVGGAPREWSTERIFASFWLGWLVAIAVLEAWHLVAPVAPFALAFLGCLAALGLLLHGAGLARDLYAAMRRRPGVASSIVLLSCWLANRAIGPPIGDSGVYHLSAIRWFSSFPVVPGLANVVRQFGFNNPSLLWSAALEIGPLWGRSSHLGNGILMAGLGARSIVGLARCMRLSAVAKPVDLFAAVLLAVVVGHAVTLHELMVSGPDPDSAAGITVLAATIALVASLTEPEPDRASYHSLTAMLLGTLAAFLKLSVAPYAVLLVAVAIGATARGVRTSVIARWFAVSLLLGVPWLARGVVLSGYPLYPSGLFPLGVDWRLPESDRAALMRIVIGFLPPVVDELRAPGESWVRPWLVWQATRLPELAILPAALAVLGLARVKPANRSLGLRALWVLVPGLVSIVVWVATAPHPRFAYGPLWACAAAAVTAAGTAELARTGTRHRILLSALLIAVAAFPAFHRVAAWMWRGEPRRAIEALFLGPGEDHGFYPTPRIQARSCITSAGLTIRIPPQGEVIWDTALPAAMECDPDLALRHPGDLSHGFVVHR